MYDWHAVCESPKVGEIRVTHRKTACTHRAATHRAVRDRLRLIQGTAAAALSGANSPVHPKIRSARKALPARIYCPRAAARTTLIHLRFQDTPTLRL